MAPATTISESSSNKPSAAGRAVGFNSALLDGENSEVKEATEMHRFTRNHQEMTLQVADVSWKQIYSTNEKVSPHKRELPNSIDNRKAELFCGCLFSSDLTSLDLICLNHQLLLDVEHRTLGLDRLRCCWRSFNGNTTLALDFACFFIFPICTIDHLP